jgi:hypothetical protein
MTDRRQTWGPPAGAVVVDVVVVLLFVAIGRHTHDHGVSLAGMASTSWPFLAGLAVGWVVVVLPGGDGTAVGSGAVVCLSTVAVGMALRVVAGQGTAVAFVLVALGFLGALLLGWRAGLAVVRRRRTPRP